MDKEQLLNPEYWASQLWLYFKPLIVSGNPFYLSVDKRLLNHLLGVSYDEVKYFESNVRYFHEACSKLFVEKGSKLSVDPKAFKQIDGKPYSSIICLASQQVIVVEEMLRDKHYSEHSYFPRYRKIINFEKGYLNSNPIVGADFLKIWNKLKEEIESTSKDAIVTFSRGLSRRDVNRNFPLSQALLTTQDLISLKRKYPNQQGVEDDEIVLNYLLRKRNLLGQRGRSVILRAGQQKKKRLVEQFKSFIALDYDYELLERELLFRKQKDHLVAFIDRKSRFFSDSLSFAIWNGEDNYSKGEKLKEFLKTRLYNTEVIMIADNRKYVELKPDLVASHSNTVLIVVGKENDHEWMAKLSANKKFFDEKVERIDSNISDFASTILIDMVTESEMQNLFGNLVPRNALSLVGGIPVDAREKIYLKGYCPVSIKYNDVELNKSDTISVNGQEVLVGKFFESLKDVENQSFELSKNGRKIGFSVLVQQVNDEDREYGYFIDAGRFSPFADLVEPDIPALVGPCIRYDMGFDSDINHASLPVLVSIIDSSYDDEKIDQLEVEVLVRFLNKANLSPSLRSFAIQKVNLFKTIKPNPTTLSLLGRVA